MSKIPETIAGVKPSDPKVSKIRTYRGYYHFRSAAPLDLVFEHDGGFHSAIERFILHCNRMNYKFIKVRPFVVDLDERERRRNDEGYLEDNS